MSAQHAAKNDGTCMLVDLATSIHPIVEIASSLMLARWA